jgi:hypothetical protein
MVPNDIEQGPSTVALVRILLILQNRSRAKHTAGQYNWSAISSIMKHSTGIEYTYDQFIDAYESSPALQNIVSDYNDRGLTLVTQPQEVEPESEGGSDIESSAKTAAKKTLDRP